MSANRTRPPSLEATLAHHRALELASQDRNADAVATLRAHLALEPEAVELRATLATLLVRAGASADAQREYEVILQLDDQSIPAIEGLGGLAVGRNDFSGARELFLRSLAIDPRGFAARFALYDIEQALHDVPAALLHQARILQRRRLFSIHAAHEERRVLIFLAPGDWQANVPVDFLIDFARTTVHKLYLLEGVEVDLARVPIHDVIFTAIAESDAALPLLRQAHELARKLGSPLVNAPQRILNTNRERLVARLGDLDGAVVPRTLRVMRPQVRTTLEQMGTPSLIRPVASHAGIDLARLDDAQAALDSYLACVNAETFYLSPFVDYRSADGYFRKYRIIIVDGEPLPFHMAISKHWMIHYYNAPMRENRWMREEEERFLTHFQEVIGETAMLALRELARRVELEYVGVDCGVLADGRLVVFEADPAMIVHRLDPEDIFAYRKPAAARIFAAFARLLDSRRA